MSLGSRNYLPERTSKQSLFRLLELLGYKKLPKDTPDEIASYMWFGDEVNAISFVGVELSVWKEEHGLLAVDTRTRLGRSYWDLKKQNETIRALKSYFGGRFETDEGKNRLFSEDIEPSKLEASLFVARWVFHNNLGKYRVYAMNKPWEDEDGLSRKDPTGLWFLDALNPRFFINELLIPYFVAIWEEYLRSSYKAIMRHFEYANVGKLKRHLLDVEVRQLIDGDKRIEEVYAETFSFQRPDKVHANFNSLYKEIDIGGALKRPFRRRKKDLFTTISEYVDIRNEIAHAGKSGRIVTDVQIERIASDFEAAANRVYEEFERSLNIELSRDY